MLKDYACERNNRLERKSQINVDLREDLQGLFDVVRDTLDLMPLPLTLTFFFYYNHNNIIIITTTTHCTIIVIVIINNYYYLFSLSFLFPATLSDRLKQANILQPVYLAVFWCILYFWVGVGGGEGFVLGQFSFRAPESLTLRTTNGEKITIKNRQLPLATQAKYNLIDLSVQVRFTVVQIYISLNPFMQSLYNIHCNFIYNC